MAFDKCPNCGYNDEVAGKKIKTCMNKYVNTAGKKGVFAEDADTLTDAKGVVWTRADKVVKVVPAPASTKLTEVKK